MTVLEALKAHSTLEGQPLLQFFIALICGGLQAESKPSGTVSRSTLHLPGTLVITTSQWLDISVRERALQAQTGLKPAQTICQSSSAKQIPGDSACGFRLVQSGNSSFSFRLVPAFCFVMTEVLSQFFVLLWMVTCNILADLHTAAAVQPF